MPTVIWTKTALDDTDGLVDQLMAINVEAGLLAAQAIRQAGDSLNRNAKRGTMVQGAPGVRKLRVPYGKHGFVIHYAILEDEVVILKVYHGRQDRPT
jgi:plasmid stabilization system protein ParE